VGYLIKNDYLRIIQPTELAAITANSDSIRILDEKAVQQEIRSFLTQKYDLDSEFSDTTKYSFLSAYGGGSRVYLDATAYSATSAYSLNALTLQAGSVYINISAISSPGEAFNASHWTLLGSQYDIFYCQLPFPLFNQDKYYTIGDKVFWKGKTYTAARASVVVGHEDALQYIDISNIRSGNVFPDTPIYGAKLWGAGTTYTVPAGTLPTDTAKFTFGDNRDQQMISLYLDLVIYMLCKRINPGNVPEARHNAWVDAKATMKSFADGDLTSGLPRLQTTVRNQGQSIIYGGSVPKQNNW